jgi:hypothetical protein
VNPWLSIVGGGLVSVLVTIGFNVYWDGKKQRLLEDWEFRRYHANQIHLATAGLMEAFFAAKAELYFLFYTLETLAGTLTQLVAEADVMAAQQGGGELADDEIELRNAKWLQPFRKFNQEQVALRWNQHEQRANEIQAKAETHMNELQALVPAPLFNQLLGLYAKLNTRWSWSLQAAQEQSKLYEDVLPEVIRIRAELMQQIEIKMGRS